MKYYYYNYDYLIQKLKDKYKTNTLIQLINEAGKD